MLWFFVFKQKTAYEMRISDWSSDVCSSDLRVPAARDGAQRRGAGAAAPGPRRAAANRAARLRLVERSEAALPRPGDAHQSLSAGEIGRASCRERVCQSV